MLTGTELIHVEVPAFIVVFGTEHLTAGQNTHKILDKVKCGKSFAKWGKTDEMSLNGLLIDKNIKIGGKNWNSL